MSSSQVEDAWVTTDVSCRTRVYISGPTGDALSRIRRYELVKPDPCELVLDTSFGEIPAHGIIAADDAGRVYEASYVEIARIAPGPKVTCTGLGNLDGFSPTAMTITADGTLGFVGYTKYSNGQQVDRRIVKLTTTATGCAVTPLQVTGVTLSGVRGLAVDAKGRLHVADDASFGGNGRYVILDQSGAFVAAYDKGADGTRLISANSVHPCKKGMCLDTFFDIVTVDADGAYLGSGEHTPTVGISFPSFRSGLRGAQYVLATEYQGAHGMYVAILRER